MKCTTRAHYYDGRTPLAHSGRLQMDPHRMRFLPDAPEASAQSFAYRQIRSSARIAGRHQIEIKPETDDTAGARITFDDDEAFRTLENFRKRSLPLSSILDRIRRQPLRRKALISLAILPLLIIPYFAALERAHGLIPTDFDRRLGSRIAEELRKNNRICDESGVISDAGRILHELIPAGSRHEYRLTIVENRLPNAFALPGGEIFLHSGLIEQSGDSSEVAAVLAHEISHVELRHGIRQMVRMLGIAHLSAALIGGGFEGLEAIELAGEVAGILLYMRYSREFESEADEMAAEILKKHRISLEGFINFLERTAAMSSGEVDFHYLSSHPPTEKRIRKLKDRLAEEKIIRRTMSNPSPLHYRGCFTDSERTDP